MALIMESFCRKYNVSYRIRKPQDDEYGSDTDGDGQASLNLIKIISLCFLNDKKLLDN